MDYQLDPIYELYQNAGDPNEKIEDQGQAILKALKNECSRVLTLILHSRLSEEATRSIIRRHQYSLTILQNKIHKKLEDLNAANESSAQLNAATLKEFSGEIVALGASIRKYFPTHFDTQHPAGLTELESDIALLNDKLDQIKSNSNIDTDKDLFYMLREFLTPSNLAKSNTTYFQLDYLHKIMDQLLDLSEQNGGYHEQPYINLLIANNFNCPIFFHYCCSAILSDRDGCSNITLSYHELLWNQKNIQQIHSSTSRPFNPSLPGIKQSLLDFIQAEISYMQNLNIIAGELNAQGTLQDKFKTSFSVKELAFFIHLQVECGIILEDRPKRVHEYVVGHYSTRETMKISEKSFKNAYYSNSREDKVTAKLAEMLARAQQKS